MEKRTIGKLCAATSLLIALALGGASAGPVIRADLDRTNYVVGDLVTVRVNVSANSGLHGLFFDLDYDGSIFSFVDLAEAALPATVAAAKSDAAHLLYAVSDPIAGALRGNRVIVSFAMNDSRDLTSENGYLVDIVFRVTAVPAGGGKARFAFNAAASGAMGLAGAKLDGTRFVGSSDIAISAGSGAYVRINAPVDNQAVYEDTVPVYATSSAAADSTYVITNRDVGYVSKHISARQGSLNAYRVPVSAGINRIKVELRKKETLTLAYDEVVAFRSEDEVFVKIVSPLDHALVNTDEIRVLATSPFASVTVNGRAAELLNEKRDGKNLFASAVWLKKGFNVIVAQSVGPQDIAFTSSIAVYYQRDDRLFKFIAPDADSVIKTIGSDPQLAKGSLRVRGEIGSDRRENGLPNRVTLRVVYTPANPGVNAAVLVDDEEMAVTENALGGVESEAPYVFANPFSIPVADLDNGELEIIAYKNKNGSKSDGEIHRFVKLDKNKLAIDLVQPNVFGSDVLDSEQKFAAFNGAVPPDWGNLVLADNAAIGLAPVHCEIKEQTGLAGLSVASLIEAKDGTKYALVNTSREMRIYRKGPEGITWGSPVLKNSSMHGYALRETDVGILVGVSNLSASGNSGLYLFADGKLSNVVIGEPIPHVQFIEYRDGYAYLYGNEYSHLYSFSVFSLQETPGAYRADVVAKTPCANESFLKQFALGPDAKTALLLDNDGRLSVLQNLSGSGYAKVEFNAAAVSGEASYAAVVPGTYRNGTYRAYLLVSRNGAANSQVLMENVATNRLIPSAGLTALDIPDERLIGAAFAEDRFALLYKRRAIDGNVYTLRKANILFNQVGFETAALSEFPSPIDISPGTGNGFGMTGGDDGSFIYGQNADTAASACYEFVKNFPETGEVRFDYKNPDAERLDGFSFYVDQSWLTDTGIRIGFGVYRLDTDGLVLASTGFSESDPRTLALPDFLAMKNDLVTVTHSYDDDRGKELVTATFADPAPGRYLSFAIGLSSVAGRNRSISELTIQKKKAVKLPRSGETTMAFPISGWVADRTAHEIQIQEKTVPLESNGYFLHFYELNTTQETTTINLSCRNDAGERVAMPFTVKIFDSVNEITNVGLETASGTIQRSDTEANEYSTDQETLVVSADIFGMEGCVAGYETYAYVTADGREKPELLSSGVFDYVEDSPIDGRYASYGTGYVSARVSSQPIALFPGVQRLVLYVENPGGKRAEYTIAGEYPEVEYDLAVERQKILIQNSEIEPLGQTLTVSGVAIDQQISLVLRESATEPYVYARKYTLKGRVNSITRFTDLRVKTNAAAVTFADGSQTTTVEVDELNRFEVDVYVTMPEDADTGSYAVLFIPTTPYLEPMKTGVIIAAEKDYTGAYIVPNFTAMDAANWSTLERAVGAKAVRVRIARHVPSETSLSLLVNFETTISGTLVEDGVGTKLYKLLDEDRKEVSLTGVKNGVNRVQWVLSRNTTISSSSYARPGMDDYTLELQLLAAYVPTSVAFDVDQTTYFADPESPGSRVPLPNLLYQKRASTAFVARLNGQTVYIDEGTESGSIDIAASSALRQGRNELVVEFTERDSALQKRTYAFLYDSEEPIVRIADYRYERDGDGQYLASLCAIVQEANVSLVELIDSRGTVGTQSRYVVNAIGGDTYEIRWNDLISIVPRLNPTPDNAIAVRIADYAGNVRSSPSFAGIASLPPVESMAVVAIPMDAVAYRGAPAFEEEASHWGSSLFPGRMKAYAADMEFPSLDVSASDGDYTVNRSGVVRLGKILDSGRNKTVTVNAGTAVKFSRGFSIPRGTSLVVRVPSVSAANPVSPTLVFKNDATLNQLGVSFWLRIENEGEYAPDLGYKKVLTIAKGHCGGDAGSGSLVDYEVYLAYRDHVHGSTGDETLALIERHKLRGSPEQEDETEVVLLGEGSDDTLLARSGSAGWNLVTLAVDVGTDADGPSPFYRLSVNGNQPVQGMHSALRSGASTLADVSMADLCSAILAEGAEHGFGWTNGSGSAVDETARNGHFSVARAFTVNKSVTNKDVVAMADRVDEAFAAIGDASEIPAVDMALRYDFTRSSDLGPLTTAGARFEQLRLVGPIEYYHAPQEDSGYRKPAASGNVGGSLRASSLRVNRIKASADGLLVFRDAGKYLTDGLRATGGTNENEDWIILEPNSSITAGRYAFANNYTSHTLLNSECYSIYGKAAPYIPGTPLDAALVLSINGVAERYRLEEGEFHFEYHKEAAPAPSRVSMYIEAKTPIKIGKAFFLTEGTFRLPDEAFPGLSATLATTKNIFQKTGTIEFWYKPMIAAKNGFLDENVTLFDSEFVQISTELVGGRAMIGATVKKEGAPIVLRSAAPLLRGWQHIQFSWSRTGGSHVACLYLNGRIVSKLEGADALPLSPSMEGKSPAVDNVAIGANMARTQYAEGFIDEVRIDNLYVDARYERLQPITAAYTDGFDASSLPHPNLVIARRDPSATIEDCSVTLLDGNGKAVYEKARYSFEEAGLDIARHNAGVYTLILRAAVNGYRFDTTYRFLKNDRPRFVIKDRTGIVVNGEATDVRFEFQYDTSYLHEDDLLDRSAGLELIVMSNDKGTARTRRYVVFQKWNDTLTAKDWFIADAANFGYETPLAVENNEFAITIEDVVTTEAVEWSFRPFSFGSQLDPRAVPPGSVTDDCRGSIPFASFSVTKWPLVPSKTDPEYKIEVALDNLSLTSPAFIDAFTVEYFVRSTQNGSTAQSAAPSHFAHNGRVFFYYDDMLAGLGYGTYGGYFTLRYEGREIRSVSMTLDWQASKWEDDLPSAERRLAITEFSLLQIECGETADTANLYLEYEHSGLFEGLDANVESVDILYDLTVLRKNANGSYTVTYERNAAPIADAFGGYAVLQGVPVSKSDSIIKIRLYDLTVSSLGSYTGLVSKGELPVVNRIDPPQVLLTNSVPSRIGYNNVKFSWTGYYHNEFRSDIKYSYNLDDAGWSSVNAEWRSVEYFNLSEGSHKFRVRAHFGSDDNTSSEAVSLFFIDVSRPVIDTTEGKIAVERVADADGFTYEVNLRGQAGAVVDSGLSYVLINGKSAEVNRKDGSFTALGLPVTVDGVNEYVIAAYDLVGNRTERTIEVDNAITEILYPADGSKIRYTPITIVGRIPTAINKRLEIYVADPLVARGSSFDYAGWRRGRMNEDFTFFVEDVTLTPGTYDREAHTVLEMAVVTPSGRSYTKEINLSANEVARPIDLSLSLHAAEGERADTEVTLSAKAKVANISSWSVDFSGDGIYDDVVIMDEGERAQSYSWTHTYSSLGVFKPRVRVITKDGIYFSVEDTLTVHEKIREASNKAVADPISLDSLSMEDGAQRLFVLAGKDGATRVEVYEIGRNESYVSNKLYGISLAGLGIASPVRVSAVDAGTLLIAENIDGAGILHTLVADEFEAFHPVPSAKLILTDAISDVDCDGESVFITLENSGTLVSAALAGGAPNPESVASRSVATLDGKGLGGRMGISKDDYGILLSDYYHQRVVRLTDAFSPLEYVGEQGTGEGQFIKPRSVRSHQNRLFVYDEGRSDVQFFDPQFKPITRLAYDPAVADGSYLEENFLRDVVGITVFTRTESGKLFYYAVLLSRTSGKLSVIRMPQWEEMRATVRNNKIIFLKDNEVYSAKPTGSDIKRLISSDSIPRINGSVDYPALSPDGRMISFTSRAKLLDGSGESGTAAVYAYDNLYVMNVDGAGLQRIPLSALAKFEIERPQFNSNGTQLVFSAKPTGGNWQLYTYAFATGCIANLLDSKENARFPYFSPDDRFIAFTTDYDGDEEIQIYDTVNPTMRVSVTDNSARDSFPVWNAVYPDEIADPDAKIESKIAFVSERNAHKGVYYAYVSRKSEADVRIVTKTGQETGGNSDAAAIELTRTGVEGDYPCFTGDGTKVVYESYDGVADELIAYDYPGKSVGVIDLLRGSRRPAGMKNAIARFAAEIVDGNSLRLTWSRYTDSDVFYTIRFRESLDGSKEVEKRVFTQDEAFLSGLEMGMDYLVRVSIEENGEEAASTQWKKVHIPEVVARPSYEIDERNPYIVHLYAWTPNDEVDWGFTWIIDNRELPSQSSGYMNYQFSTSGVKSISLKVRNKANTYSAVSSPMAVPIVSDVVPVITYLLSEDRSTIQLSPDNSLGRNIDYSSILWTITGTGSATPLTANVRHPTLDISALRNKINVSLRLSRIHVNDQANTDTLETSVPVDLYYRGTKLVITQEANAANVRFIAFSGAQSVGNFEWRESQWRVFRNGAPVFQTSGSSSFAYEFPETDEDATYSVSLTVLSKNDAASHTATNLVTIKSTPIEPEIDYEIVTMKDAFGGVVGAKIIFSATNSKGNNIDFSQAKWTVPVAASYGDEPVQVGPTAVYNLFNSGSVTQVAVTLTLLRKGETKGATLTRTINIEGDQVAKPALIVKADSKAAESGTVVELNVLSSTGANIDWEKTAWHFSTAIDAQAQASVQQGPAARILVPANARKAKVRYTVTLYFYGATNPIASSGEVEVGAKTIRPVIAAERVRGGEGNVYNFSVANTAGANIDWDRTTWYFYDGNANVTTKAGSFVTHAFVRKSDAAGYPVMAVMYFRNGSAPFYGYKSVDIEADRMVPVIAWDRSEAIAGSEILFSASGSLGANIDWAQAKWNFGDGSAPQYGASASHQYPISSSAKEYRVSLTLTRTLANGDAETATTSAVVASSRDVLKPVVKAKLYRDGYLVLSSEESEGRGLLLNQSAWMFAGKGDSSSINISKGSETSSGTTSSSSWDKSASVTEGWNQILVATGTIGNSQSSSDSSSTSDSTSLNSTDVFSNDNYHVGMTARRWIGDYDIYAARYDTQRTITVSLNVCRQNADGGMEGKTITVNVNLADAVNGVSYK